MREAFQPALDSAAPPRRRAGDRHIFLRHWLRDPLGIGAAQPSGDRVARAMAREVVPIWAHFLPTQVWRYRRAANSEITP